MASTEDDAADMMHKEGEEPRLRVCIDYLSASDFVLEDYTSLSGCPPTEVDDHRFAA